MMTKNLSRLTLAASLFWLVTAQAKEPTPGASPSLGLPDYPANLSVDSDGDGVSNIQDNCPGVSNPDQADNHPQDGVGDACPVALGASRDKTCVLLNSGEVKCFGEFLTTPQNSNSFKTPTLVSQLSDVKSIAKEGNCGLLTDGSVMCWGVEEFHGDLKVTEADPLGDSNAVKVAGNGFHGCACLSDGTIRCWGMNFDGQLGNGSETDKADNLNLLPPSQVSFGQGAGQCGRVAVGYNFTCSVMKPSLNVWCWGANHEGQLGGATFGDHITYPVQITDPANVDFSEVAAGDHSVCAKTSQGEVYCWGKVTGGYSGNKPELQPLGASAQKIAVGELHACAVIQDKTLQCWGLNIYGQLGIGYTPSVPNANYDSSSVPHPPTHVPGLAQVIDVVAGAEHTCALLSGGYVKCWGSNSMGQLGDGTQDNHWSPMDVSFVSTKRLFRPSAPLEMRPVP